MIKLEIDDFNESALRHMGKALQKMADDLSDEVRKEPKDLYKGDELYDGTPETEQVTTETQEQQQVTTETQEQQQVTTEQTPAADIDTNKHIWDERIHTGKKTKNADGTWKIVRIPKAYKSNPDGWNDFVQKVLNELNAAAGNETENPDPNAEFSPPATANNQNEKIPSTLAEFMDFTGDKFTKDMVNSICLKHEVPSIFALGEPDYVEKMPLIYAELKGSLQ